MYQKNSLYKFVVKTPILTVIIFFTFIIFLYFILFFVKVPNRINCNSKSFIDVDEQCYLEIQCEDLIKWQPIKFINFFNYDNEKIYVKEIKYEDDFIKIYLDISKEIFIEKYIHEKEVCINMEDFLFWDILIKRIKHENSI